MTPSAPIKAKRHSLNVPTLPTPKKLEFPRVKSEYQKFLDRYRIENPDIKGKWVMIKGAKEWNGHKEM